MEIAMDFATILKFVHITTAILWVGGGFSLVLAGILLGRSAPATVQVQHARTMGLLGPRFFMPVSIATLASGLALVFLAGWGWQPFTVLGLLGVVLTSAFGMLVIGPSCGQVASLAETQGPVAALPVLRRLYRLVGLDYALQFAVVFLMVAKPGWQDVAIFAGLGAILALAAMATFRPVTHPA
jgi:uncharacterized membrane protein